MSSSEIMLEEMRHAFDTAYESVKKYANKTFTVFGAELALLLFYLANDEISNIKNLFSESVSAWWIFAVLALITMLVAAILFIVSMSLDTRWHFPPNPEKMISEDAYEKMSPDEVRKKLIDEYHRDIEYCIKRTGAMKVLTNVGTYFLVAGVLCLLLIKFFGV